MGFINDLFSNLFAEGRSAEANGIKVCNTSNLPAILWGNDSKPCRKRKQRKQWLPSRVDLLLIDVSGSMYGRMNESESKIEAAQQAGCAFIERASQTEPNGSAGVVSFGDTAVVGSCIKQLKGNKLALQQSIKNLELQGGTQMDCGLACCSGLLKSFVEKVPCRIVVLTDGYSCNKNEILAFAKALKGQGVQIDAIGIGEKPSEVDEALLKQVASTFVGECRYWFITDVGDLTSRFETLALREVH